MWHTEQFCGIFLIIRNEWVDGLLRIASGKSQFSTNIGWTNRNASISYRRLVIQNETRPEFREQQPRQVLNIILSFIRENLVRNSIIATDVPNTRNVIKRISFNKKQKQNAMKTTMPHIPSHIIICMTMRKMWILQFFLYFFLFISHSSHRRKIQKNSTFVEAHNAKPSQKHV